MRLLLPAILATLSCASAEGDPRPEVATRDASPQGPLVLELFTSQGCSSCPSADALLAKLAKSDPGRPIAPLSFHVDYWNGLGWADPFSLPAWTQRQNDYANALGDDRVYTPELIVGGRAGMVGSNRDQVTKSIASAPHVGVLPATGTWSAGSLEVTATAPANADVFVAIWETTTSTKVPRGENAGETLISDRVVRRFELVAHAGKRETRSITYDAKLAGVGAVAFAQRVDRTIVASALLPK